MQIGLHKDLHHKISKGMQAQFLAVSQSLPLPLSYCEKVQLQLGSALLHSASKMAMGSYEQLQAEHQLCQLKAFSYLESKDRKTFKPSLASIYDRNLKPSSLAMVQQILQQRFRVFFIKVLQDTLLDQGSIDIGTFNLGE